MNSLLEELYTQLIKNRAEIWEGKKNPIQNHLLKGGKIKLLKKLAKKLLN